jgi:flagellar basal body P-ring formation protein FlgA
VLKGPASKAILGSDWLHKAANKAGFGRHFEVPASGCVPTVRCMAADGIPLSRVRTNGAFARRRVHGALLRRAKAFVLCGAGAFAAALQAQHASREGVQMPSAETLRQALLPSNAVLPVANARVEILPGSLDPRLKLAACAHVQAYLPSGAAAWGRTRIGLRCTDGAARWNVFLPVQVRVWAPALVAAEAAPSGALAADLPWRVAEVDWAEQASPPIAQTQALAQRRLGRPLAAGQALRWADLQQRQWFASGDSVTIVARGAGFQVTGEGQALGVGLEGQAVRVRTESGRIITALPVAARRVEMSL